MIAAAFWRCASLKARGCSHHCSEESKFASFPRKRHAPSFSRDTQFNLSSNDQGERTMIQKHSFCKMVLLWTILLLPTIAHAQVTQADYERAASLRTKFQGLAVNIADRPT